MNLKATDVSNAKSRIRVFSSPTQMDRLYRIIWGVVQATVYRYSPNAAFAWRRYLLKLFGASFEGRARPYPRAVVWAPWNLCMKHYSCLANGVICYNVAKITIGEGATVSQGAHLCSASHDFRDPAFQLIAGEITIGAGAWVAADAFVGPGVWVGENAVVGARTVVTRDVPASVIVAGNPAKEIGKR